MSFSPKSPGSMIGTFAAVLIFTMFKELFEDIFRMISDFNINNAKAIVLDQHKNELKEVSWKDIKTGDIIKIEKDRDFPCDMLLWYSKTDVIFVDTMNLDGETNLKPKTVISKELFESIKYTSSLDSQKENKLVEDMLSKISGSIECDQPSENLESWNGNFKYKIDNNQTLDCHGDIGSLLLRGCFLRNTEFCFGIAVYLGQKSKIMMNAKKPKRKVSNLMKLMNYMLYTVFGLQIAIIILFATLSCIWINNKGSKYDYLDLGTSTAGFGKWIIQLFTYWVAYSHMIPISLYVMIEVLKLVQASLIKWDSQMWNEEKNIKPAECKNSDLIEELGQVDFIFSDKTGTLTQNKMIFKCCSVDGKIYDEGNDELQAEDINSSDRQKKYEKDFQEGLDSSWRRSVTNNKKDSNKLYDFFKHMTICHSVMVDKESYKNKKKDNNELKSDEKTDELNVVYQCSSPDELALIEAARAVKITLADRTKEYVIVQDDNDRREYRMHAEFVFDSKRKRMSTIVEENKQYFIYTKGADSEMIKKIKWSRDDWDKLQEHLHSFAVKGLRTLVMGKRNLNSSEFNDIIEKLNYIKSSNDQNKEKQYDDLYEKYEDNLDFVGASAIEDLLQDKVPETIEKLLQANIRLWVLTGDKQETAIEIAKSWKLIQEGMEIIDLSVDMKKLETLRGINPSDANEQRQILEEGFRKTLSNNLQNKWDEYLDEDEEKKNPDIVFKKDLKSIKVKNIAIVVDGLTLALILGNPDLEK